MVNSLSAPAHSPRSPMFLSEFLLRTKPSSANNWPRMAPLVTSSSAPAAAGAPNAGPLIVLASSASKSATTSALAASSTTVPAKTPSPPPSSHPAAILSRSFTMENSANSWLSCATQSASLQATPVPFILPWLSALPLLLSFDQPTPPATALIPPKKSSYAAPTRSPPTSAANPPTHLFSISPSIKSSTPCNAASEPSRANRRLFRALACSPRIPPRQRRAFGCASHVPLHPPRRCRPLHRPHHSRLCRRLSPQAGSPHRHRSLRPHAQSSLLW